MPLVQIAVLSAKSGDWHKRSEGRACTCFSRLGQDANGMNRYTGALIRIQDGLPVMHRATS